MSAWRTVCFWSLRNFLSLQKMVTAKLSEYMDNGSWIMLLAYYICRLTAPCNHSLLPQMAAQKQEKHSSKMKNRGTGQGLLCLTGLVIYLL